MEALAAAQQVPSAGPPLWATIIISVVSSGLVASLVSTYLTNGRESRSARAKVRERLSETEDTRWMDADYQEFRKALSRLESSALIAGVPRGMVLRYAYLAEVAHYTEMSERNQNESLPPRSLPVELARLLESVVQELSVYLWHPWRSRFKAKRRIWALDTLVEQMKNHQPDWSWNVTLYRPRPHLREPGLKGALNRRRATRSCAQLPLR